MTSSTRPRLRNRSKRRHPRFEWWRAQRWVASSRLKGCLFGEEHGLLIAQAEQALELGPVQGTVADQHRGIVGMGTARAPAFLGPLARRAQAFLGTVEVEVQLLEARQRAQRAQGAEAQSLV